MKFIRFSQYFLPTFSLYCGSNNSVDFPSKIVPGEIRDRFDRLQAIAVDRKALTRSGSRSLQGDGYMILRLTILSTMNDSNNSFKS